MKNMRIFCADSPYGKDNCPYAKVVEEEGNFPVISEESVIDDDGNMTYTTKEYVNKYRFAVYCTYPKGNKKLVGTVEPYGGICRVPKDCPENFSEMTEKSSKFTIWQRIKAFFT